MVSFFAESSCKNLTCLNSGYCVGDLQGHANCVCQGGHAGTDCSVGMLIRFQPPEGLRLVICYVRFLHVAIVSL